MIFCTVVVATPLFSHAQLNADHSASLELSPQAPLAHTDYSIKVTGTLIGRNSITWFIDGKERPEFKNQNSIKLTAGDLGKSTTLDARVVFADGSVLDARQTIHPTRIDIIVTADTTAPPFYEGRKLPTNGSTITATAHVFTQVGKTEGIYSYLWKVNGKVQNGGALRGKNAISFSSVFDANVQVSVDVLDGNGQLVAQRSIQIPMIKPEVYFYETNPLRGLSNVALPDPDIFIGDEVTLRAETYFMSALSQTADMLAQWSINNIAVPSDAATNNEITLTKQGNGGRSTLSFKVHNIKQLLQNAEQSTIIQF